MVNLGEAVNYIIFTNPISTQVGSILKQTGLVVPRHSEISAPTTIIMQTPLFKLAQEAGPFVRMAGLMGASAVVLGAYGAHKTYPEDMKVDLKKIFETANRFHFIHSLALLSVPLCRKPVISGSLITLGTLFFCGSCYYRAFTGDTRIQKLAPIGGSCLILGWLAMVL